MMDAVIAETLQAQLMSGTNIATLTGQTNNQTASKTLETITAIVVQAQGSNSDDAGLIAALQTAAGAPRQGALAGA